MDIRDEIDMALGLSHTQHIGTLFHPWFRGAHFIIILLEERVFTNANVPFRMRFRDGTSIVERTAQRSNSSLYNHSERERGEGTVGREAVAVGAPQRAWQGEAHVGGICGIICRLLSPRLSSQVASSLEI